MAQRKDDMALVAERLDQLTSIMAATSAGHYQRQYIAFDIANPAPLGFMAFAYSLALFSTVNAQLIELPQGQLVAVMFGLFLGGVGMFTVGVVEMLRRNTLAFTAFSMYACFWLTVGLYGVLRAIYTPDAIIFVLPQPNKVLLGLCCLMGILAIIFGVVTCAFCLILPFLFVMLSITFFTVGAAFTNPDKMNKPSGYFGMVTAACSLYAGMAFLIEDCWGKELLPIFYTKLYKAHAARLFPRLSQNDPRSITAGVPYPGRFEIHHGDNTVALAAPSLENLDKLRAGQATASETV